MSHMNTSANNNTVDSSATSKLGAQLAPCFTDSHIPQLSERQKADFERNGFILIENALSDVEVAHYRDVVSDLDQRITKNVGGKKTDGERKAGEHLELRNAVSEAKELRDLMVHPMGFGLIAQLMGGDIALTTSHVLLRPPSPKDTERSFKQACWHRDGPAYRTYHSTGREPWLYTKVGFFLTDTTIPDCGALRAIPGSHRYNGAAPQDADHWEPYGAVDIGVKAGSAIIFDNRIWHCVGPNYSNITRENIYLGYCWRYVRPIDYIQQDESLMQNATPIQKQLLGASEDSTGFFLPKPSDVPLREFLQGLENT